MQKLTLNHWSEQLQGKVSVAAMATAECVHQAAIGHGEGLEKVATGAEHALLSMELATKYLLDLARSGEGAEVVRCLEGFQRCVSSATTDIGLFINPVEEDLSPEVRQAVVACRTSIEALAEDTERLLSLEEVREARLSHRAQVAKDKAQDISRQLHDRH